MKTTVRAYDHNSDFEQVGRFLTETYRTSGEHINWLQPRWEYMHFHPLVRGLDLTSTGIWESDGEIVAVAHAEHSLGTAYLEFGPNSGSLKKEMVQYAESCLSTRRGTTRHLGVHINDRDGGLQRNRE